MPTVALAMIARNAAGTLGPAIESVKDCVDEIVVVLGGPSVDDTEKVARRYTDKVIPAKFVEDFSAIRQPSFDACTKDWIFWIDADDVVLNPERLQEAIHYAEVRDCASVTLRYQYQKDEFGNTLTEHEQYRLFRRDLGWKWGCPCRGHPGRVHEVCLTDTPHVNIFSDMVEIEHHRAGGENLQRNLRLSLKMIEENPACQRTVLALAHSYFGLGDYTEAQRYYERYYGDPESELERWHAAVFCGKCAWQTGRWAELANWAMIAVNSFPELQDGYLLMAQAEWWANKDAARTLTWLDSAREKQEAPLAIFRQPFDYTINRYDVEHRAYAALEMWPQAMELVRKGLEIVPGDKRWVYQLRLYEEAQRSDLSVHGITHYVDHLVRHGDVLKASSVLAEHLPHSVESDRRIQDMRQRVHAMLQHVNGGAPRPDAKLTEGARRLTWNSSHLMSMPRVQYVERRVKELGAKRVLDIGCQAGALAIRLAKVYGCEVVGVDSSEEAIKLAKKRARKAKVNVKFRCEDARMIHEEDVGHFDLAIALEIIEHMPGSESQRLLGLMDELADNVIISSAAELVPTRPGLEDTSPRDHIRQFSMNELWMLVARRQERRLLNLYKLHDELASEELALPGFGTLMAEYDLKQTDYPRVVIYCGPGLERWSPLQIEPKGLGGSETGAVKLAEELVKLRFTVLVYGEWEGFCNGVVYRRAAEFNSQSPYFGAWPAWLMISSRIPAVAANSAAQHRWLWMHDVDCQDNLTEELAANIDRIVVLSEWHKGHVLERYPFLDESKLLVIGDGLIPELLPKLRAVCSCLKAETKGTVRSLHHCQSKPYARRHSFIYSSSPDRGLDVLLGWWPEIREMWPDAELHVCYGWHNFDVMSQRYPVLAPFKRKVQALMQQDGVVDHGRLGQRALYEQMAKTQFWLYPSIQMDGSDWHETFCITALEVQACGVIPLTRCVGALPERLNLLFASEHLLGSLDPKEVVRCLRDLDDDTPERLIVNVDKVRQVVATRVRKHTWASVAAQWRAAAMLDERERLMAVADEEKVPEYV